MARRPLTPFGSVGSPLERHRAGDPFLELHRDVNRLFEDVFRSFGMPMAPSQGGALMAPHIDVGETENEIYIYVELPGVPQEAVEVTLDDDILTIRGEKRAERENRQQAWHVTERSFGRFQRSLQLPFTPSPDQIQAKFENGVLTITLPKARPSERTHRIAVKAEAGTADTSSGGSPAQGAGGQQEQPPPADAPPEQPNAPA